MIISKNVKTALIIDDERLARTDLSALLDPYPGIQVVGEAEDVPSALAAIKRLRPDVIFLDIQMPGESGFDLLERLDFPVNIVFVTAYDEYAIRAFEVNALDYLLKPVNPERLESALSRLDEKGESKSISLRKLNYGDRLFLMLGRHFKFLKIDEVMAVTAAGDYTEVMLKGSEKSLTLKSMKEWENRLPERYFVRIHRATILNMEYIDRIEEWFNYSFRVYLNGVADPFIMSRRCAARLKEHLG